MAVNLGTGSTAEAGERGPVAVLDASASCDEETNNIAIFLVNRQQEVARRI